MNINFVIGLHLIVMVAVLIRCDFLVDQCVYINNIIFTFVVSNRVQLSTSNFHENPKCTLYERVL